ncbi:hypothetical protein ACNQ2O_01345 [Mycoplasma sp. AA7A]|uniref:hypothetical protein n=1 Tax=Mycoplasma sp. AA7A TaxID=3401665 RepID=UPI003AAD6FA6
MKQQYPEKFLYRLWVVDNAITLYADVDNPEDFIEYGEYETLEETDTAIKEFITNTLWEWEYISFINPKTLKLETQDMNFRNFSYEDIKNNFRVEKVYVLPNGQKLAQWELEKLEEMEK